MGHSFNISLRSFIIFNPTLSSKEDEEHKKLLFYYPENVDLDTKIKEIGLVEAIIKFTSTFNDGTGCKSLHTQKSKQIFLNPEENIWMIMILNAPYDIRTKDEREILDYKSAEINETLYNSVLERAYNMFRLFAGKFENSFVGKNLDEKSLNLQKKLKVFYSKYLLTLKFDTCDIIDTSIHYLPLPRLLFLKIYNVINMIKETFPLIQQCVFLYNERLVWSEINPNDLCCIYEYYIGTLLPKFLQRELQGVTMPKNYWFENFEGGPFITSNSDNTENELKTPKLYIYNSDKCTCFHLVTYRIFNATLFLFVDESQCLNNDFYVELHSFINPQISSIASQIGESITQSTVTNKSLNIENDTPKFLFINELNLNHTGTIHVVQPYPKKSLVPQYIMNLIIDLYKGNEVAREGFTEETIVKAFNDYWIVKKTSNWRQFYVVINNSRASLLDIANEAKKVFEQETKNVYFET